MLIPWHYNPIYDVSRLRFSLCFCFSERVWLTSALRALSLRCSLWLSWAEWSETGRPCPSRWLPIDLSISGFCHISAQGLVWYQHGCHADFVFLVQELLTNCLCVFQYPLKEVVVIHQDPEALKDIQSLQKYILEVSKQSFLPVFCFKARGASSSHLFLEVFPYFSLFTVLWSVLNW